MQRHRAKVLVYQTRMCPGGAQRITLSLLEHLDRQRFQPMLVVRKAEGEWMKKVPSDVTVYDLGSRVRSAWYRFGRLIRELDPNILVSMSSTGNITAGIAHRFARSRAPLIMVEHNTFSEAWVGRRALFWILKMLKRWTYRGATRVVAVSRGVGDDLIQTLGLDETQIRVIHNPIVDDALLSLAEEPVNHSWFDGKVPVVLTAGRLTDQKDYPMLIEAFGRVREEAPAKLVILGEGERRGLLEDLVRDAGLDRDVAFLGYVENPYSFMKRSAVFTLSSRYEGFGNVLVEAMACGVAVVSTDCASGPGEIITDEINGLLVPVGDAVAMGNAICGLLRDPERRARIAMAGRQRAADFSMPRAITRYGSLLQEHLEKADRREDNRRTLELVTGKES